MSLTYADDDAALFDLAPVARIVPARKPSGVPESTLVVLAEVALKEADYPEGVPAVGLAKSWQLDKLAEKGLLRRITLADPDVDEGPRRLALTDAGRAALEQYDAWADAGGFVTMRGFVARHLMGAA